MSLRVLILQPDAPASGWLRQLFLERGDLVWQDDGAGPLGALLAESQADLVTIDLHGLAASWRDLLATIQRHLPRARVLFTTAYPDPALESQAVYRGTAVFLSQPYTADRLDRALATLFGLLDQPPADGPAIRSPLRLRLMLPQLLIFLAVGAALLFLADQLLVARLEANHAAELATAGQRVAGAITAVEDALLDDLRLVTFTSGLPNILANGQAEQLQRLVLPLAANRPIDALELLDLEGRSALSLRRDEPAAAALTARRGDVLAGQWPFVDAVLTGEVDVQGDKFGGLVQAPWGNYFYVAGPVRAATGERVGAALIGLSLPNLVQQLRQRTGAEIVLYNELGQPVVATLTLDGTGHAVTGAELDRLLAGPLDALPRQMRAGGQAYSGLIAPLIVRGEPVGLVAVLLPRASLAGLSHVERLPLYTVLLIGLLLVLATGVILSRRLTGPVAELTAALQRIAAGEQDVHVDDRRAELAPLVTRFNEMVAQLRQRGLYRQLLGGQATDEQRQRLHHSLSERAIRLAGQEQIVTAVNGQLLNFTGLIASLPAEATVRLLDEYYRTASASLLPAGGVITQFDGQSLAAHFGLLPEPSPPPASAFAACQAAVGLLDALEVVNLRRQALDQPPLVVGLGINTGAATLALLGDGEGLRPVVVGEASAIAERLESVTRSFAASVVVISHYTYLALGEQRDAFELEPLGMYALKDRRLVVYRLAAHQAAPDAVRDAAGDEAAADEVVGDTAVSTPPLGGDNHESPANLDDHEVDITGDIGTPPVSPSGEGG